MYIGTVQVGHRIGLGVVDEQHARFSMGASMGADVTTDDYLNPSTDIVLTFPLLAEATKNTLKAYLNTTVKQGGSVVITPDAGDDMQVQRSVPTPFIFLNMKAVRVSLNMFRTQLFLRFIGVDLGSMFVLSGEDIVKIS